MLGSQFSHSINWSLNSLCLLTASPWQQRLTFNCGPVESLNLSDYITLDHIKLSLNSTQYGGVGSWKVTGHKGHPILKLILQMNKQKEWKRCTPGIKKEEEHIEDSVWDSESIDDCKQTLEKVLHALWIFKSNKEKKGATAGLSSGCGSVSFLLPSMHDFFTVLYEWRATDTTWTQ